jgi:hypothetical protein
VLEREWRMSTCLKEVCVREIVSSDVLPCFSGCVRFLVRAEPARCLQMLLMGERPEQAERRTGAGTSGVPTNEKVDSLSDGPNRLTLVQ